MQTRWRGYKAKSGYKKLQRGALVAQCLYRGRLARRELRKLKLVRSCKRVFAHPLDTLLR